MPRRRKKQFVPNKSHGVVANRRPPYTLAVPAGPCPFELKGTSDEEIVEWATSIKKSAKGGCEYTVNAIQYWVREFYQPSSSEWKEVRTRIFELRDKIGLKWIEPPKVSEEAMARFKRDRNIK